MARRVYLHVGTPKSGTSFLQALWWHHADLLGERGLLLPGRGLTDHFHAASAVTERTEVLERLTDEQRAVTDRLLDEVAGSDGNALISHELFAPASAEQAVAWVGRLAEVADEVHVVVTARDLARQLPSGWQQSVKQGRLDTLREFWEDARDHADSSFWSFQDVPALLDRWTAHLPAAHRHLVVLPRPGAPRDLLWQQVCALTGVDPAGLTTDVERANESLGLAEVELMRRVHAAVPEERRGLDVRRIATGFFTQQVLVPAGSGQSFVLPADVHAWTVERGTAMVDQLAERDLDVVGDLADLVPGPSPGQGRTPDDVTDQDVAALAPPALARMLLSELDRREEMASLRADKRRLKRRLAEGSD